mmetsp:Transcript_3482/g.5310  ORF Transcript_3482/g.5310 Transcript_3482/m.5310 type:complete len:1642 (-) Transcript_3482:469-5394(-)
MSSQREASTPLGTPISSLQGAAIFQRSVASEVANEIVENDDYLFDDDEEDIYDEDEDDEDEDNAYGEEMVVDGTEEDALAALIGAASGNGSGGSTAIALTWSEQNRIRILRSLFPGLNIEQCESALRWTGGDVERADRFLREMNVVSSKRAYTTEIAFPRTQSSPAFRKVSDESLTLLVSTGFRTQLAAAALRRYPRVDEAAAWILDRGEAEGTSAIANDERELNVHDATVAADAAMSAVARLAEIPQAVLDKLSTAPEAAGLQHDYVQTGSSLAITTDTSNGTTTNDQPQWCPACCKELNKNMLRCAACGLCESCRGIVHCCPGIFNGGHAHRHALRLVRGPPHADRYCDVSKANDCAGAHCIWSWRCTQCDFDVCTNCIQEPLDPDFRTQQRVGGGGAGRLFTGRRGRAAALQQRQHQQAVQQPPIFAITGSRDSKLSGTVRSVDANALDDEIAARWAGRSTLFDVSNFLKKSKKGQQQMLGFGIVGASSIESSRSRKKRRLNLPSGTARTTKGSTERQLRREERLILADFYNNTSHRSATALALAESMLSQSNMVDVAGRRGIEAALASGDLGSAAQLLVGSNALYRRLENDRKKQHAKLIREFRSSMQQEQEHESTKQLMDEKNDVEDYDDEPVCTVCYGDLNSCEAVYCLGTSSTSSIASKQHGLHAACAADLLLGGGDCPRCREPLFQARLESAEAEEAARLAQLRLKARTERLHFRLGDAVFVIQSASRLQSLQTPRAGGFQQDMSRYCGVQGVIIGQRDPGGKTASADVQFYDGVILRISAAALSLAGENPTPHLSSSADDTSHFATECGDRLRDELVAVRRARDEFISETLITSSTPRFNPNEQQRQYRLQKIVNALGTSDSVKINLNALDTAARAVRHECLRKAYELSAWTDAQKPGRYRVATSCFLDLKAAPKLSAPRTGFRLGPGTCFSAEKEILDEQGRWWIKLAATTQRKKSWRKGESVDATLHLPQAIGAKVVRGVDFKTSENLGDLGPYAEILGADRKRPGSVRVRWIGSISSANNGIISSSLERKHRAGGENTKTYELAFASDAPPAQPPPQGWLQARLNGPGTPLAIRRVQRTLRCFACGDDLCFDNSEEPPPIFFPGYSNMISSINIGDYAIVKATLERVQVITVKPGHGLACRFVNIPILNTENDLFIFREDDLLPVAADEKRFMAETRREMVLRLGFNAAQKQYQEQDVPQLASCLFGHAMHPRCFQGRLASGQGCPACNEPLWFPPKAIEPGDDDCCNRNGRREDLLSASFVELDLSTPANLSWRFETTEAGLVLFTTTASTTISNTDAGTNDGDVADVQMSDSIERKIITALDLEPVGETNSTIGTLACSVGDGEFVRCTLDLRNQRDRIERLMRLAANLQLRFHMGFTQIPGEPEQAQQSNQPQGVGLRMCPVCCAGPLANEQCSDLRAHHSQCPRCQIRIANADTRIAEALSAISSGRGPASVGECIPKCPNCKIAVTFNGCLECGKLYQNLSWDSLPRWDPNAKRKLEKAQRDRNQMRALAIQVRREASFLAHEKLTKKNINAAFTNASSPNSSQQFPLPGTTNFGTPPIYSAEIRHTLKIACDDDCSRRHVNGPCLVCGLDWGEHSGHSCPDGQRGSWVIDFNDDDDNNNDIFE